MPHPKDNLSSQLDYEGWRDLLRSMCGERHSFRATDCSS
jgi:hypothetical protein